MTNFFEHIIIGSGAAGSIAAYELIKEHSSVAIIEEGQEFNSSYFKVLQEIKIFGGMEALQLFLENQLFHMLKESRWEAPQFQMVEF